MIPKNEVSLLHFLRFRWYVHPLYKLHIAISLTEWKRICVPTVRHKIFLLQTPQWERVKMQSAH